MSRWKLRDPSLYPITFTEALISAANNGEAHLGFWETKTDAKIAQERFCCFRHCLRHWPSAPGHRGYRAEMDHAIRTRVVPYHNGWTAIVSAKPILRDTIATLNPDLQIDVV